MFSIFPLRVVYTAFILGVPLFLATVFFGYFASISTSYPQLETPLAILAALVPTIAVLFLMRSYAKLNLSKEASKEVASSQKFSFWSSLIFSLVLLFSAIGVLTAATLIFEGPVILREDVARARERLAQLSEVTKSAMRIPQLEELEKRVLAKKIALENEIKNPMGCGMGPVARSTLRKIQEDLPGVVDMNPGRGTFDCKDKALLDDIYKAFEKQIDANLSNHPLAITYRRNDRAKVIEKNNNLSERYPKILDTHTASLAGVANLISNIKLYADIVRDLSGLNASYVTLREEAGALSPRILDLPHDIGNQASEAIVRPLSVFGILLSRSKYLSTYVYSMIPILLDILMLGLVRETARRNRQRKVDRAQYNEATNVGDFDVVLLCPPLRKS